MPKYKNPQIAAELAETEINETVEKNLKEGVATPEEENWKKRYGDLRRHQQEQEASLKAEIDKLRKDMGNIQQGKIRPPKTEAELKEWEDEYPDFASIMDARVDRRIDAKIGDLKVQSAQMQREKALLELKSRHPDAQTLFSDPDFHDWLSRQSKLEQDKIYKSFDVDSASFVLDKYKAKTGKKKSEKEDPSDRDIAKAVKIKTQSSFSDDNDPDYDYSESQIERETSRNPRWWSQNEAKIDEARRKGRVKYDMTGGARR